MWLGPLASCGIGSAVPEERMQFKLVVMVFVACCILFVFICNNGNGRTYVVARGRVSIL